MTDLSAKILPEKFGPVRGGNPFWCLKLPLRELRHREGISRIALRFPRIQRWRKDKKPEEADSLETMRGFAGMSSKPETVNGLKTDEDGNFTPF